MPYLVKYCLFRAVIKMEELRRLLKLQSMVLAVSAVWLSVRCSVLRGF